MIIRIFVPELLLTAKKKKKGNPLISNIKVIE